MARHQNKKVIILIAVRMKSRRLSQKALLKIEDKTVLEHLLDRLKLSKTSQSIVVCTSVSPEDDILTKIAEKNGVKWFRGSEDDVMDRFIKAADKEKADIIVRITGDNILIDPFYLDKAVKYHLKNKADYTSIDGLPSGVKSEIS